MENITVYTSTSCHYCHLLKDYLKEKNVAFDERNIDTDSDARAFLIKNRIMGVPAMYVGEQQIVGFDKEKIDEVLGL
ncbi:glutaredoxin-like protein, YruB-family [Peptoanaerobacter stomatis]|jgi:glutaredoxin|uniref:Glutaredoxin-like protein, YruB-family n=1 Tax=Peptoanaerobacter stomatis TaxID=796937 RepID=G9WZF2_9FIRM|nr:glutaredoxin family protein [Peptoanaerobacter stomatis]NWO25509.1 glutaredoxin family protein [Peptostreptococcaceae bacterium oral taxon 081]EHL14818.1 glutaredoxin-like protein, YruB-family [Peptoanaerobacter stomatis]EHL15814.1 hypothetical protein HMPREF9628_00737 [Peptoanaerobacter stomatis]EHL15978.1 hypothetical protein HMPREF9629_01553 [Peptoanaerobacter stomatis]EJU22880.1 YruB family protein [Peptoanaerobacter stomatis]